MDEMRFYHVFVQRAIFRDKDKINWTYEINFTRDQVIDEFLLPFKDNRKIICNGHIFESSEISVIRIYFTEDEIERITDQVLLGKKITDVGKDVTRDLLEDLKR